MTRLTTLPANQLAGVTGGAHTDAKDCAAYSLWSSWYGLTGRPAMSALVGGQANACWDDYSRGR